MNTLRAFLKIYKIELPDKIEIDIPKIIVKKGDIPYRCYQICIRKH